MYIPPAYKSLPPKNKKNEKKNATNLQVLRNRSTCTYDIGVGNGKYPTPL